MHSISAATEKLIEQKRGSKHYMTFTFSGFYWNAVTNSKQFAEVQLIHKETNSIVSETTACYLIITQTNFCILLCS